MRSNFAAICVNGDFALIFVVMGAQRLAAGDGEGEAEEFGKSRGISGARYMVVRFDGLSATQKLIATFNGTEKLFEVTDKTSIRDGDKQETLVLKDLEKYQRRRATVYYKDGKAIHVNFTTLLDK